MTPPTAPPSRPAVPPVAPILVHDERASADQPSLVLCELGDASAEGLETFSPFCLKVHRALALSGLAYARRHGAHPGVFKALNPTGQVPVLLVDGEPVTDSTRIVQRLQELSGYAFDGGPGHRAQVLLVEELADTAVNAFLVAARWADEDNWPRTRKAYFGDLPPPARALVPRLARRGVLRTLVARDVWRAGPAACWERFEQLLDHLDEVAPTRGFWVTEAPTTADVALFGQLQSLRTALTPGQRAAVERRGRLLAWLDRVDEATAGGRRERARAA